ncbi:MAG: UDP-N-acetylmuramoyl-L-alanine--D-glutamate ligase [Oxalobacteraceae bacterium]
MNLAGKHALVLGLGESGLAIAHWVARAGARVRVADTRPFPERLAGLRESVPNAEFIAGEFTSSLLETIDLILLSPGLSPGKELAAILPVAHEKQIPVWGEIELFAQALAALKEERGYQPKVLAITGTNGKTTVTSLTGHLCRAAGMSVEVAGNISPAALDVLRQALDQDSLPEVWVLELSSFQLWSTHTLDADAATVLNLTQDHLDWHGDMDAYAKAKQRIFGAHSVRVLNRDDARVMKMASKAASVVSFGTDAPAEADCLGMTEAHGMHWLMLAVDTEEKSEKKRRSKARHDTELFMNRLMPADALKIRGRHNATNVLAALALCRAIDLPLAPLLHAARQYKGEPHRVESVTTIAGVEYVDDSKGTNVGATIAALEGLGDPNTANAPRLILLAGGDGKGQDFTPLAAPVQRHAKAVMLIGRDGPAIRDALKRTGVPLTECWTLEQAVERATDMATEGDIVLLSPACASFDMFTNYAHRAEVFVNAVREVGLSRGEVSA